MQCKRCKTFFKYDKYDGICPQCAYFNRPPGMEEVDLFEEKYVCSTPWCGYSKEFTAEETAAFEKMREKSEEEAEPR